MRYATDLVASHFSEHKGWLCMPRICVPHMQSFDGVDSEGACWKISSSPCTKAEVLMACSGMQGFAHLAEVRELCTQVRAGVRQKVAAALEQAEALEAKIDSKQAEHDRVLAAMQEDKSALQRKLAEAQIATHSLGLDLQAVQQKAARQEYHH